jgi:putative ABC transport system ATP-binding protein
MTKHETQPPSAQTPGGSQGTPSSWNATGQPVPIEEQETCSMALLPPQNTKSPAIVVRNLGKAFQERSARIPALRDLSFQVQRGEFVALTGPAGAGKSVLLRVLGCLIQPSHGDYWLAAKAMSRMSAAELANVRNQHVGFVFEEPALLPGVSALDNVALPLLYAGFARAEQERRAQALLQFVGLGARARQHPARLSPWQQQRVALARALVNNPFLLLVDEPVDRLDRRGRLEILAFLQALQQRGLTIVLATREAELALYAARQITLRAGRIEHDAPVPTRRIAINELASAGYTESGNGDGSQRQTLSIRIQEELL